MMEMEKVKKLRWDEWRKSLIKLMNKKKYSLKEMLRKMEKKNDGIIKREEFIDGIMKKKFENSRIEMNEVEEMFDR
jgi:hypothetical protein